MKAAPVGQTGSHSGKGRAGQLNGNTGEQAGYGSEAGRGGQAGLEAGKRRGCRQRLVQRDGALKRSVETQRECETPFPNYRVISLLIYYRSPLVTACTTDTTENNKTCERKGGYS